MRTKIASCLVAVALVAAVGCGDDDDTQASGTTADAGSSSGTGAADAPVTTAETSLGDVLVDAEGMTVYGFTDDTDGTPTCGEGCSDTWAAVTTDGEELPAGLDSTVFGVVEGIDGGFQLTAGDQPLYTFGGDSAPGDVNGQGVDGTWFVVGPDGEMITEPSAGTTTTPPADDSDGGYGYGYGY